MTDEKTVGNTPTNPGDSNANKGAGKNNRRRSLRSKRRGRKPEEGSEPREPRSPRAQPSASKEKEIEKSVRDNRDRRRRRRMRAKQRGTSETPAPIVGDVVKGDAFKDLPPLVPAFVYTHVLRPSIRDSFEFRTEHFSKVTRKMEDFHIDLSPLYPDGGDEIKGVGYMPPLERTPGDDEEDDELEDGLEDPEWDSEESRDAARLDGAIADEFYDDLGDTVDDPDDEGAWDNDPNAAHLL